MPPPSLHRRPQCRPQAADGFRPQLGAPRRARPPLSRRWKTLRRAPIRPAGSQVAPEPVAAARDAVPLAAAPEASLHEDTGLDFLEPSGTLSLDRKMAVPGSNVSCVLDERDLPENTGGTAWSAGLVPVSLRHGSVCPGHSRWCKQLRPPPPGLQGRRVRLHATAKRHAPRPPAPLAPAPRGSRAGGAGCPYGPGYHFFVFVVHLFDQVHNSNPRRQIPGQNSSERELQRVICGPGECRLTRRSPGRRPGGDGLLRQAGQVSFLRLLFYFSRRKGRCGETLSLFAGRQLPINLRAEIVNAAAHPRPQTRGAVCHGSE